MKHIVSLRKTVAAAGAGIALVGLQLFQAAKLTAVDPSIAAATNSLTTWLTDNVPAIVSLVLLIAAAVLAIRFVHKRVKRMA